MFINNESPLFTMQQELFVKINKQFIIEVTKTSAADSIKCSYKGAAHK
jgi:hypothetical protein